MFLLPLTILPRVSSSFGPRVDPYFGKSHTHNGIDLSVPEGTPVLAAAAGTVSKEWTATADGRAQPNGNALKIDHGNGYATAYLHLSRKAVGMGARVSAGQVIGYVGSTGASTGPHLHFMVYQNGTPVDPKPFIVWSVGSAVTQTGAAVVKGAATTWWVWGGVAGIALLLILRARSRSTGASPATASPSPAA